MARDRFNSKVNMAQLAKERAPTFLPNIFRLWAFSLIRAQVWSESYRVYERQPNSRLARKALVSWRAVVVQYAEVR
eukprot:6313373-Amphidinium_carterae.1